MKKIMLVLVMSMFASFTHADTVEGMISDDEIYEITCGQKYEIKDHMMNMGFIIRSLSESIDEILKDDSNNDAVLAGVLKKSQKLRVHLSAVFPKTPEKLKKIDPEDLQKSKLVFQRYLHILIGKTIDLDELLLEKPTTPEDKHHRRLKVAQTVMSIYETVELAHALFRD